MSPNITVLTLRSSALELSLFNSSSVTTVQWSNFSWFQISFLQWQRKELHEATQPSLPYFRGFYDFQTQILSYYYSVLGKFINFSVYHCSLSNGLISCENCVSNPLSGSDLESLWVRKVLFLSLLLSIRKILMLNFFPHGFKGSITYKFFWCTGEKE